MPNGSLSAVLTLAPCQPGNTLNISLSLSPLNLVIYKCGLFNICLRLRLKFPHLVHGSVSTSGPMLAKADFSEYLDVVSAAFNATDSACDPAIRDGLIKLEKLTLHWVGWNRITKDFK